MDFSGNDEKINCLALLRPTFVLYHSSTITCHWWAHFSCTSSVCMLYVPKELWLTKSITSAACVCRLSPLAPCPVFSLSSWCVSRSPSIMDSVSTGTFSFQRRLLVVLCSWQNWELSSFFFFFCGGARNTQWWKFKTFKLFTKERYTSIRLSVVSQLQMEPLPALPLSICFVLPAKSSRAQWAQRRSVYFCNLVYCKDHSAIKTT